MTADSENANKRPDNKGAVLNPTTGEASNKDVKILIETTSRSKEPFD